ncbi:MAG: hypothetical protein LBR79_02255 [Oscillospiraceae bacterium]|nr:hypothetical protein [Oscillospiraceae bacterium]
MPLPILDHTPKWLKLLIFPNRWRGKNKNVTVLKSFYYICRRLWVMFQNG